MIEVEGPALSYVHVATGRHGGQTEEVLVGALQEMNAAGTGNPEMQEAIGYMLSQQHSGGRPFDELRSSGRTLIAVYEQPFFESTTSVDGIFYAEGTGELPRPHDDAFSTVRMGVWLRRREGSGLEGAVHSLTLAAKVVGMSLRNTENATRNTHPHAWGVPVARETTLGAFPNTDNSVRFVLGEALGRSYGEWQDTRAVEALEVPVALRGLLLQTVKQAHDYSPHSSFEERTAQLQRIAAGEIA